MFLFENFTYDNTWASQYYENFYDASEYIENFLNDDYTENGKFCVKMCYSKDHENNRYHISYLNNADIFDKKFPYKAYVYAYKKLKNYGDAITVAPGCWPEKRDGDEQCDIIIRYDKDKDELRWNKQHEEINIGMIYGLVLDCKPSIEQWISMIYAYDEKKNPNRLFNKEKDIRIIGAKYIIAVYLKWEDAISVLETKISTLMASDKYKDRIPSRFPIWIKAYANFMYEPDNDIKELINDFKDASKNKSESSISTKLLDIAKKLDQNGYVKKYQVVSGYTYAIDIMTKNGNTGRVYIEDIEDDPRYKEKDGLYKMYLYINPGNKYIGNTATYKFKALPHIIDSVVNALYKNDPEELNKITIKI